MKWEFLRANEEFKWLNLLVEYKYDHYQGYSPAATFSNQPDQLAKAIPDSREKGSRIQIYSGKAGVY